MSLSKVLDVALGELGNTEFPPGSNRVKYWEVMPSWNGQPWCVVFLLWCFRKAGEAMAIFGGAFTASCSTLLAWYKSQGQVVPVEDVQVGDIVLLNFHGGKDPEHCGLVVDMKLHIVDGASEYSDLFQVEYLVTIEGNTIMGEGNQSNGGMVCEKRRYLSQIVGVCRPMYKEEEDMPKDDLTDHWAEKSCRKAERKAIMKGYPDGTWRPDQAVTRAELAVILDRLGLLD